MPPRKCFKAGHHLSVKAGKITSISCRLWVWKFKVAKMWQFKQKQNHCFCKSNRQYWVMHWSIYSNSKVFKKCFKRITKDQDTFFSAFSNHLRICLLSTKHQHYCFIKLLPNWQLFFMTLFELYGAFQKKSAIFRSVSKFWLFVHWDWQGKIKMSVFSRFVQKCSPFVSKARDFSTSLVR